MEASDIADYTSEVVRHNNFSHVITVLHSYVEDLCLDQPVDLIISEWMGTLLLVSVVGLSEKYRKSVMISVWLFMAKLYSYTQ